MQMRGMPSICSTAQRAPGKAWSESVRGLTDRGRFWPEHPASPDLFVMASAEIDSFRMTRRVFSETRSVVGLSKGGAI